MTCNSATSSTVNFCIILCLVVISFNNVVAQIFANSRAGIGVGLPLPMLKEENIQGHTPSRPTFGLTQFSSRPSPSPTSPLIIKYDDDKSIISPNLGIGLGQTAPSPGISLQSGGPGSLQHVRDPHLDPSIQALINHPAVLKKIQKDTNSDSAVRVEKIIAAHRQVVSGEIIYLDLKVIETKCTIGTRDLRACGVDSDEEPYICEVAVWSRPWLNSTKIVDEKSKCAEVEKDNSFNNWNKGSKVLRWNNPAVLRTLPPFLDENQLALEAFDYINRGSESKFKGQIVNYQIGDVKYDHALNITTTEVKVEYGFTLCLKFPNRKIDDRICPLDTERDNYLCSVTVMSDPNLTTNLKVVPDDDDDIDCDKKDPVEEELVVPVKAVCMGCPQSISLNDPSVLNVASFAVIEHDRSSDESELHAIVKIHKAQTQVTNGIKYFLTIELTETDCRKPLSAVNMNRTLCSWDLTEEPDICEVVVLEQPWQKVMELESSKCYDKSDFPNTHKDEFIIPVIGVDPNRHLQSPTGFVANPSTGPRVSNPPPTVPIPGVSSNPSQASVEFVLSEFNRQEVDDDDDGIYKVVRVIQSTTENESVGQVDNVVVELGETICTRRKTYPSCPFKIGEESEVCSANVLRGMPNVLLSLSCDDSDEHYRLTTNPLITLYHPEHQPFFVPNPETVGAPGGPIPQPTNASNVWDMARFVVDQFNFQSDEDELYKLGRIINVYSQVSGTTVYTLELELLQTECKKYQPVADVSKCPVESGKDSEICQAEVTVSLDDRRTGGGAGQGTKRLTRIFCDDREDFYVKKSSKINGGNRQGTQANWKTEDAASDKVTLLGRKVADEFDFRSDEDNIFVLFKVIESKTEEGSELTHLLRVELAETVCPKYKSGIDKSRCIVDIGEEHKICDAEVVEQPWNNDYEVDDLRCFERDDSKEIDDESREILYRRVHPSAHARPKFIQSMFRERQHSKESDESNEKYYTVHGTTVRYDRDSDEVYGHRADSTVAVNTRHFPDTQKYIERHPAVHYGRDDDEDDRDSDHRNDNDDNDSRSYELHSRSRSRRSVTTVTAGKGTSIDRKSSIMTGASTVINTTEPRVKELADFSLRQLDLVSGDDRLRRVEEVLSAYRKVVAGLLWSLKVRVSYTHCKQNTETLQDLSVCQPDLTEPHFICYVTILEKLWMQFREVRESKCIPESISTS